MRGLTRYLRLLWAMARYSLARELAFRGNFLAKVSVEVLWLFILLVFYRTIFQRMPSNASIAEWTESRYMFFVGCYFALEGLIETFFLENCNAFADLVRSGDLDFYLLKPIDEQFLISLRDIDWSTAPNVLMGGAVMVLALLQMDWTFDPVRLVVFLVMLACGAAIAYSFLILLTSTSVYFVRNQSLYEMWWLFTSLMRYPRDIFRRNWAAPIGWVFSFVIPVMLVIHVPASVMVKVFDPAMIAFTIVVTLLLLLISRKFFRASLRRYRSASS
jgi:ABC-2 type transport system permease protein